MKITVVCIACLAVAMMASAESLADGLKGTTNLYSADDPRITYVGRFDFSNKKLPRVWAGAAYVTWRFEGTSCKVLLNDQVEYGKYHNYLEIVVDGVEKRVQTTGAANEIDVADGLTDAPHTVILCKDTEALMGYIEFEGVECEKLLPPASLPERKVEFIGDSITAGSKSDTSQKACGAGDWYENDNAYMGYGPRTARALDAQWHVSAVSGIGMVHSCCDMKITMPDVYGTVDFAAKGNAWDFGKYQPDVVTVCLGQNDGDGYTAQYIAKYVEFLGSLRSAYPNAQIVCLTSPMADPQLTAVMQKNITEVVARVNTGGDEKVHSYYFAHSYNGGCGDHPSVAQHALIANELTAYLKTLMGW